MSSPLRKTYYIDEEVLEQLEPQHLHKPKRRRTPKRSKKSPLKAIASLFMFIFLAAYGYFVCPYCYENYFKPLYLNRILNYSLQANISSDLLQATSLVNNSWFIDKNQAVPYAEKSKTITDIQIISEMTQTKNKILELAKQYPKIEPSVFVWEYSTGSGFEINSDEIYSSASIIKIPIVFELIRLIDETSKTQNPITLTDKRLFSEQYRTSGSGDLQFTKADVSYSLDHLANITIANSDNSATNMLLYEIGGIDGFNRSMRNLGLKTISMGEWLPDLNGFNKISAREISKILYNIDNPRYINPKYKNILNEYLSSTRNVHLLKEKLPANAKIFHKTGDIGTMLGDSGIIYTDNGKKYIVTILAKRPHNYYGAKTFIQDASLIIYNDIKALF